MSSMRRTILRNRGRWLNSPVGKKFVKEQLAKERKRLAAERKAAAQ